MCLWNMYYREVNAFNDLHLILLLSLSLASTSVSAILPNKTADLSQTPSCPSLAPISLPPANSSTRSSHLAVRPSVHDNIATGIDIVNSLFTSEHPKLISIHLLPSSIVTSNLEFSAASILFTTLSNHVIAIRSGRNNWGAWQSPSLSHGRLTERVVPFKWENVRHDVAWAVTGFRGAGYSRRWDQVLVKVDKERGRVYWGFSERNVSEFFPGL